MLFLVFGSSGSGKTFALPALRERLDGVAIHDFDEIGVPAHPDTAWRHRANEEWVRRALDYQAVGQDLLLAGQTPLGELLATPSAPLLDAISACLVDCDDGTRLARLNARGSQWLALSSGDLEDYLNWAEWMRRHAADPRWRSDVIRDRVTDAEMRWERWSEWDAGDARWHVHILDTSAQPVERVANELAAWVRTEQALVRANRHPLHGTSLAPRREQ